MVNTKALLLSALIAVMVAGLPYMAAAEEPAPSLRTSPSMKDMDKQVRLLFSDVKKFGDPSICLGGDGKYYLIGTLYVPGWEDTIQMWRSDDLKKWEKTSFSWKPGDSPWHKKYVGQMVCAPEIHYMKKTFWIAYSLMSYSGKFEDSASGLLRSTTGKAEGPYVDVWPNERLGDEIDSSLFEDDDGTVYFLWHNGMIRRMKPDMSGPAEPGRRLKLSVSDPDPTHHSELCSKIHGPNSFDHVGYEGCTMIKVGGTYILCGADRFEGRYTCWAATSKNIYGPYSARYPAIPNGGHNVFFRDKEGQWWSTIFNGPITFKPGILPINVDENGQISLRE